MRGMAGPPADATAENPLASGDPGAWSRAIQGVRPASIVALIDMRMSPALRQRIHAEDIWQETLLQAWRDRERFEWNGLKGFRCWLVQIAENRLRDAADREGALRRGGLAETAALRIGGGSREPDGLRAFPEPAGSSTPSRSAVLREQAEAMRTALSELPVEVREIVRLRVFEELTMPEVATRLGLTVAVARHRFRAGSELYSERLAILLRSSSLVRVGLAKS